MKPSKSVRALTTFEAARAAVCKDTGVELVQLMNKKQLLKLQKRLGLGEIWGEICFPEDSMAPGGMTALAHRRVNFYEALRINDTDPNAERVILQLMRYILLCTLAKASVGRSSIHLKPASIMQVAWKARALAEVAMAAPLTADETALFGRAALDTDKLPKRQRIELNRMQRLQALGFWMDVPQVVTPVLPGRDSVPAKGEKASGAASSKAKVETKKNGKPSGVYLPLPDEFVAAAGWRIAWLIEEFTPDLLRCAEELAAVCAVTRKKYAHLKRATVANHVTVAAKEFLTNYSWRTASGDVVEGLPFELSFFGMGGGKAGKFVWPVATLSHFRRLLRIIQSCNMFAFLLSTGGRISEMLSLNRGCIVESPDGIPLANGRTYKMSYKIGGSERDWPLPEVVLTAIRHQEKMSELLEKADLSTQGTRRKTDSIWAREGRVGGRIDSDYNHYLRDIANVFGLEKELGDGNMHAHRFRKTIARLIALAIVGAPKIVMDLFGHRHINQALHYILADDEIRAEILEIASAQTLLLAKEALTDDGELGGPAAGAIRAALTSEQVRMGEELDADGIEQLAETLTMNHRSWMMVRRGILCTKPANVAGACSPRTSMPDTASCKSNCGHRLERSYLRDDVDGVIADAVEGVERAEQQEEPYLAEMWRGQIVANIERFPSLREKWSPHPIVAPILAASTLKEKQYA